MRTVIAALALTLAVCEEPKPSSFDINDLPVVFDAASNSARILGTAFADNDPVGCTVAIAVADALTSARDVAKGVLAAKSGGDAVLPAITSDTSICGDIPAGIDIPKEVQEALAIARVAKPAIDLIVSKAAQGDKCKVQAWVDATVPYAFDVADAATAEVGSPDKKVEIPQRVVALSACQ